MARIRGLARRLRLRLADVADLVSGKRDGLTPSRSAIDEIGGSDFSAVGRHLAEIAISLGELRPNLRVLDAGCGYGRVAVPLTTYLRDGSYAGFDVSRRSIRWCERHITRRFPAFRFTHVDVRNRHYNPSGLVEPEEFVFPFGSASVDVVFASSLFTHLTLGALRRYLAEASRVLVPGGRFVASFFLLNAESSERVRSGRGDPRFTFVGDEMAVQDVRDPEAAVAFSESIVSGDFKAAGLDILTIHNGSWCERENTLSYQDFVVAARRPIA